MNLQDDELLSILARALEEADPVPDWLVEAAKAGYTWRTIDTELAELVFDSDVDELAGVRGPTPTDRHVTFRAPGVEVEVMVAGERRRLIGQLVPPQETVVELQHGDSVTQTKTDSLGRFSFEAVATGPARLRITTGEGRSITTEWVVM